MYSYMDVCCVIHLKPGRRGKFTLKLFSNISTILYSLFLTFITRPTIDLETFIGHNFHPIQNSHRFAKKAKYV